MTPASSLTSQELNTLRRAPCGQCGAMPIVENGELCHPHRIVHGCDGGLYTKDNVVPRCPSCHDIEHDGDGSAPFIGAARSAMLGKSHTLKTKEKMSEKRHTYWMGVSPKERSRRAKQGALSLSHTQRMEIGSRGGRKMHELHPEHAQWLGKTYGVKGMHKRWHTDRGIVNPRCQLCIYSEAA